MTVLQRRIAARLFGIDPEVEFTARDIAGAGNGAARPHRRRSEGCTAAVEDGLRVERRQEADIAAVLLDPLPEGLADHGLLCAAAGLTWGGVFAPSHKRGRFALRAVA